MSSIERFILIHASSFLHQMSYSPTNDHLFPHIWAWEQWGTYVMDLVSRDLWGTREEIRSPPKVPHVLTVWIIQTNVRTNVYRMVPLSYSEKKSLII